MRPVRLDLDGFASYRHATSVDFTDADYFALIGPTGSGKSTIIDAITFALYGTVPRWMDQRMITPALAPTATRGVVRLVFDADGRRYVVAREVRRSGGRNPKVSMAAARLERLLDPDDLDGDTETLASEGQVRDEVERLLGLSYDHFTTCVALPQNQFMQFLHAKPSDRQDILSSLLGHQLYEDLRARAGARARHLKSQADTLDEILDNYADATTEQIAALAAAADRTETLRDWLTETGLIDLQRRADQVASHRQAVTDFGTEQAALAEAAAPAGAADFDIALTAAAEELTAAGQAVTSAESADQAAAEAVTAFRPRHELERLREAWTQRAQIDADLPQLLAELGDAKQSHEAATRAREAAEESTEQLRQAADTADGHARAAAEAVTEAEDALTTLAAIATPADAADLAETLTDLDTRRRAVDAETKAAETACDVARDALATVASETVLGTAGRAAHTLRDALVSDLAAWDTRAAVAEDLAATTRAVADAVDAVEAARIALEKARLDDQAGELRAHLVAGEACPVCEQTVATVPSGQDTSHVTTAQEAYAKATTARDTADRRHRRLESVAGSTLAVRTQALQTADRARAELHAALTDLPSATGPVPHAATNGRRKTSSVAQFDTTGDARLAPLLLPLDTDSDRDTVAAVRAAAATALEVIAAAAADRTRLTAALTAAEDRRRAAADVRAALDTANATAENRRQLARTVLTTTRDTVTQLDPPSVDLTDLAAGWAAFTGWAATERATRDTALPGLREAAAQNATAAAQAAASHGQAATELVGLRTAESDQRSAVATLTERVTAARDKQAQLERALDREPAADKVDLLLAELATLEQTSRDRRAEVNVTRVRLGQVQQQHTALARQVEQAWAQLRATRDPLARYNAPILPTEDGLAAACAAFTAWVGTQHSRLAKAVAKAGEELARAERDYHAVAGALAEQLISHSLPAPDLTQAAAQLATAFTTIVSRAAAADRTAADQAAARVAERDRLAAQRDAAAEGAQVAATLTSLLRSDAFQAWLLDSALQSLVADASDILLEMSSGQFELRVAGRDLEVVDHNDADATRPVRTLSGGETFQASLALALALSRQVSSLAAAGAAKLESIFLDEGFGTLDDSSLDVVATTLETLASSGERIVGVITHVQALADRVPVRFQVTRTGTTSSIERVTT